MDDPLSIKPVARPIKGKIRPPGSKSLTNRALIVAALAAGRSHLDGALDSQDTRVMIDSLSRLGVEVTHHVEKCTIDIVGCGGKIPAKQADLWLENSGTSIRFLTALCALGHGTYRLDGNRRMRERPIGELVRALEGLGAQTKCELGTDCPPVEVMAQGLRGGMTRLPGTTSSQFLSALLMAAPAAAQTVEIALEGDLVSEPYIDMTLGVMAQFGCEVGTPGEGRYIVKPQKYRANLHYDIEPDASAASYFFAAAAITGGDVTVEGLNKWSLQGDVHFVDALKQMGCDVEFKEHSIVVKGKPLHGITIDMNAISDTAPTLAAVAPFATGPTRMTNIGHMRFKETDRIAAIAVELRRLGVKVDEEPDAITIHPGPTKAAVIQTYHDHRMAMSFALVGLKNKGVKIADPGCTSKTYPDYFTDLAKLCASAR